MNALMIKIPFCNAMYMCEAVHSFCRTIEGNWLGKSCVVKVRILV